MGNASAREPETSATERATPSAAGAAAVPRIRDPVGAAVGGSVLALQRAAGNAATARMVARRPGDPPLGPVVDPSAGAPPAPDNDADLGILGNAFWSVTVSPGGEAPGKPRSEHKVWKGDTIVVRADVQGVSGTDLEVEKLEPAGLVASESADATGVTFILKATKVGEAQLVDLTLWHDYTSRSHHMTVDVVGDLEDFQLACTQAIALIGARYDMAAARLNGAASAYKRAYDHQTAALDDVSAAEKLTEDLMWAAFFAVVGGAAGGAASGKLKDLFGAARKAGGDISNVTEGFLTDAAKDLTKFSVRSLNKLRGGASPETSGDSMAPPERGKPERPKGERKASGDDPFTFLTGTASGLLGEKGTIEKTLADLIGAAREARDDAVEFEMTEDPVGIVEGDLALVEMAEGLSTDWTDHLRELWHTWLANYAWKIVERYTPPQPHLGQGARIDLTLTSGISGKLRDRINEAAHRCGESGDDWIATYGGPLRERLIEEGKARADVSHER